MAWTPFSYEAVHLHGKVLKLNERGRITDAIDAIKEALDKAHREGPSNISYEAFEAELAEKPTA